MSKRILQSVLLPLAILTLAGCESKTAEIIETTDAASTGQARNRHHPSDTPTATPVFGKLNNPAP